MECRDSSSGAGTPVDSGDSIGNFRTMIRIRSETGVRGEGGRRDDRIDRAATITRAPRSLISAVRLTAHRFDARARSRRSLALACSAGHGSRDRRSLVVTRDRSRSLERLRSPLHYEAAFAVLTPPRSLQGCSGGSAGFGRRHDPRRAESGSRLRAGDSPSARAGRSTRAPNRPETAPASRA